MTNDLAVKKDLKVEKMGKKKIPKKTKELSVAIAESSSTAGEQQITPRKRGRPRKIAEKTEEVKGEESQQEGEGESKKAKLSEDLVKTEEKEGAAAASSCGKDEPRRSRRKSKPRKSS